MDNVCIVKNSKFIFIVGFPQKVNEQFQLPPIYGEGNIRQPNNAKIAPSEAKTTDSYAKKNISSKPNLSINIKDKITELKMSHNLKSWPQFKYNAT
jgi:hypothetical protein